MILEGAGGADLRVRLGNGIEVVQGEDRILLDPARTEAGVPSLVTHAHSDHVPRDVGRPIGPVYATPATAAVMRVRYRTPPGVPSEVGFGETLRFGDLRVTPLPAGHVPGSAMFLIEGEARILYTGDVNPRGGLSVEPPDSIPRSDVVIVESTYGSPSLALPDQDEVRLEVVEWAASVARSGAVPVIRGYSLGKAQELIKTFNSLSNMEVVVSGEALAVTRALDGFVDLDYTEGPGGGRHVVVSNRFPGWRPGSRVERAVATGWVVVRRPRSAAAFPLSSHADYWGLLEVVERADPEVALTVAGRTRELAESIEKVLGIGSRPLPSRWFSPI